MRDKWDLINLGQFDPNNRMIPITVIPLIGTNRTKKVHLSKNDLQKMDPVT